MLKKCKHDLSNNHHTKKVMKYEKKKKAKENVNMLQYPSSLKQMNFEMECFSSLQSHCKYRGDNLQHSVVNNNEIQSRNPRAVALSTHAPLRFSSSVSLLLRHRERQFPAMNILILHFLFWMAVSGHEHINFTFFVLNGSSRSWTY